MKSLAGLSVLWLQRRALEESFFHTLDGHFLPMVLWGSLAPVSLSKNIVTCRYWPSGEMVRIWMDKGPRWNFTQSIVSLCTHPSLHFCCILKEIKDYFSFALNIPHPTFTVFKEMTMMPGRYLLKLHDHSFFQPSDQWLFNYSLTVIVSGDNNNNKIEQGPSFPIKEGTYLSSLTL